jgi:SPP1 family predicted phage head-tail adaptor
MIGKLHNRITFQSQSNASDGAGGVVTTLVDYYTCWAQMSRNTNDRSDIAGKDNISDDITFRIRYTTSKVFTNKLVISYQSNLYNINSVINEGDSNKYFLIGCSTLK